MNILIFLFVGAVSGWLAGVIMKGSGYGLLMDIVLGVVGGLIGGSILGMFGLEAYGLIGSIVTCVVGAVVIIAIVRFVKRA